MTKHEKKLAALQRQRKAIDRKIQRLSKVTLFPIGAPVFWLRQRNGESYVQRGTIVMHGYDDRFKVENSATGKQFWLTAYQLRREWT